MYIGQCRVQYNIHVIFSFRYDSSSPVVLCTTIDHHAQPVRTQTLQNINIILPEGVSLHTPYVLCNMYSLD